jgi:hypothetical protein
MNAPRFDFEALPPVQTRGSVRTWHSSACGAIDAGRRSGRQALTILSAYRQYGSLTDAEVETRTQIQRSSVIPRRRELMRLGLVMEIGFRKNPASGVTNTTFGVTVRS